MSILMLGDSHTDIFTSMNVNRFDLSQCNLVLFTLKRFLDDTDRDLWDKLTPWFESNKADVLVITAGEIDIRAHFWKHIPRNFKQKEDINRYVENSVQNFYSKLSRLIEIYKIKKIVVWGSPVSGEKAFYNSVYPFVGSSKTRNILTHLWNREFIKIIENNANISFCSAFYNFINDNYETVTDAPSHDGVHWISTMGPAFWQDYIMKAIDNNGIYVSGKFDKLLNDSFDTFEFVSNGRFQYDTWVKSDVFDPDTINIKNIPYRFFKADQRNLLPEKYIELGLDKK
jgi:hypothetical protein